MIKKGDITDVKKYNANSISKPANVIINLLFILWSLVCVLPLFLVVAVSFTDENTITREGYNFIASKWSLYAYEYIFLQGASILRSYVLTIFITIFGTLLSLIVIAMYAYPISRRDFKYRNKFSFFVFFTMVFNGGLVPWYVVLTQFMHVTNTIWAYIFPVIVNAWYILILRTFFQTSIPEVLIESAKLDGAGEFRTFWQIVLPLSKPGLATVALFQTLAFWNDWFQPLMFIDDGKLYNLQYLLYRLMMNIQYMSEVSSSTTVTSELSKLPGQTARMAMCVLAVGPIIFAYPFFQKYFIKGLTVGAVKG